MESISDFDREHIKKLTQLTNELNMKNGKLNALICMVKFCNEELLRKNYAPKK